MKERKKEIKVKVNTERKKIQLKERKKERLRERKKERKKEKLR